MRLKRNFFTKELTLDIAKNLLGKFIVRKWQGKRIIGKIVETEAYIGPKDKASHSYLGKRTKRNRAEYFIGGHIYIYLVYGVYWQFNISTGKKGKPECVLIRALEPVNSQISTNMATNLINIRDIRGQVCANSRVASGPGKLCRYLKLNNSFYGEDLTKSKVIWLEDRGLTIKKSNIVSTQRIGIDYAGPYWSRRKWRFYLKDNPFVSKR